MKKTLKLRIQTLPLNKGNPHTHIEVTLKTWLGRHVNKPLTDCIHTDVNRHYDSLDNQIEACKMFAGMNDFKFKMEWI